jgi:hypothetical protein
MARFRQCSKNASHWYSDHVSRCPWCDVTQQTGRDPFPGDYTTPGLNHETDRTLPEPEGRIISRPSLRSWLGRNWKIISVIGLLSGILLVLIGSGIIHPAQVSTTVPQTGIQKTTLPRIY